MRSSGEGVQTFQKRFTVAHRDSELVHIRGILRCERLGSCELMVATGEGSLNCEGIFTITLFNKGEHRQIMKSNFTYKPRGSMVLVRVLEKTDLTSKEGFGFYNQGYFHI